MQEQYAKALRKLEGVANALETAVVAGAEAYANGTAAGQPIVAKHFTAGNAERYGWAPLSPKYLEQKNRNTVQLGGGRTGSLVVSADARRAVGTMERMRDAEVAQARQRGVGPAGLKLLRAAHNKRIYAYLQQQTGGRAGSRLEVAGGPQHRDPLIFGASTAVASTLPMLVRSGLLRDAVKTVRHPIRREGDVAYIEFTGLPSYPRYLHDGTPKMPKRSPVEPGAEDGVEIQAAMRRYIDAQLGTGGHVPVSGSIIPGKAREG